MKSSKECAESVLRRRDEHLAEKKRNRGIAIRSVSAAACVCIIAGAIFLAPRKGSDAPVYVDESTGGNTEGTRFYEETSLVLNPEGRIIVSYTTSSSSMTASDWVIQPPGKGEVYIFPDLQKARDEFRDEDVRYLVFIDVLDGDARYVLDEEREAEYARLEGLGYTREVSIYADGEQVSGSSAFNLTEEQLANFPVSAEYGYIIRFTGEEISLEDGESGSEDSPRDLGFVSMSDGSVCLIVDTGGTVAEEKYVDRADSDTVSEALSDDLG